jgi:hypothetical protein
MYKVAIDASFDIRDFVTPDMAHHAARDLSIKIPNMEFIATKVVKSGTWFKVEKYIGHYKNGMRIDE